MYSLASQEILNKISKIFPGAMLCDVHSHSDLPSINDFIERVVQRIPLPADLETSSAIMNMKDVVDCQELKIQMSMMESEYDSRGQVYSHGSSGELSSSGKEGTNEPQYDRYWNPQQEDSHAITDKYLSFLI